MGKLHVVVFGLSLSLAGCGAETSIEDYPCPPDGTKLTYETFGSSFLAGNCQTCHGQSTGDRKGAPSGYDFGTLDDVRRYKGRIFARAAADNVTMPPGPDDPPAAERAKLAEWLACGAP
jgi:mono/diheme cytochrome c family protein